MYSLSLQKNGKLSHKGLEKESIPFLSIEQPRFVGSCYGPMVAEYASMSSNFGRNSSFQKKSLAIFEYRYTSRLPQPLHSTLTRIDIRKKESGTSSETMWCNIISDYNVDAPSPTLTSQRNMIPSTTGATDRLKQNRSNRIVHATESISCPERKNNDDIPSPPGNSHRSTRREAALTKFRSKRKNRCYEKKVTIREREETRRAAPQGQRLVLFDNSRSIVPHGYKQSDICSILVPSKVFSIYTLTTRSGQ
ncbi:hypothetical protein V6N13_046794 [Hibiscus sabdariffa]